MPVSADLNLLDGSFTGQVLKVGADSGSSNQICIGSIASARTGSLGVGGNQSGSTFSTTNNGLYGNINVATDILLGRGNGSGVTLVALSDIQFVGDVQLVADSVVLGAFGNDGAPDAQEKSGGDPAFPRAGALVG